MCLPFACAYITVVCGLRQVKPDKGRILWGVTIPNLLFVLVLRALSKGLNESVTNKAVIVGVLDCVRLNL